MPDRDGLCETPFGEGMNFCHWCDRYVQEGDTHWHRLHCGPKWRQLWEDKKREQRERLHADNAA